MDQESLTVPEALNRGLNFFGVAVLGLLATSLIHGLQAAPHWRARIDDLALAAITVGVVLWYLRDRNRYRRSVVPLAGLLLGVAVKLAGIWLTYGALVLAGADFGIAFYLLLAALIYAWQYYRLGEGAG
jgi:uncharacterized membrane protein YadS